MNPFMLSLLLASVVLGLFLGFVLFGEGCQNSPVMFGDH
jgi:hypothetical protein